MAAIVLFGCTCAAQWNIGITEEELAEVAVYLTFFIGLPMVHNALATIAEVFSDEMPT